jgi:RecB family endonuclease NucS
MVVTFEFDKWQAAQAQPKDRLDVLGLDSDGRLVLAELKRGAAPETTEIQAIKYAAMAGRFTLWLLAEKHNGYLRARGDAVSTEGAAESRFGQAHEWAAF